MNERLTQMPRPHSGERNTVVIVTILLATFLASCGEHSSEEDLATVEEVSSSALHTQPRQYRLHQDSRVWLAQDNLILGQFEQAGGQLSAVGNRVVGNGTRFFFNPDTFETDNENLKSAVKALKGDGPDPHFQLERLINETGQLEMRGMLRFEETVENLAGPVETVKVSEENAMLIGHVVVPADKLPVLSKANLKPGAKVQLHFKIHAVPSSAAAPPTERRKANAPQAQN